MIRPNHLFSIGFLAVAVATSHAAGPASDTLLPATTVGYVSIARPEEMKDRWEQTQFGRMLNDEVMQPFVEDFRKQLDDKLGLVTEKLGVTWDDLDGVPSGELSLSMIDRSDRPAVLAITLDVTGRQAEADRLLAAVERRFSARKGRKSTVDRNGTALTVFTVPGSGANAKPQTTIYFTKDNILCGVDDRAEADAMLARFGGTAKDNLRSVAAYTATMERCRRESQNVEPELRWYAEPFEFIVAGRTLRKTPRNPHDKDFAKILLEQGFDAIKGTGGFVNLLTGNGVELHRTSIHAPVVPGKENDPLRWNLSMRMLQFPNATAPEPPSWVPRMSASYSTLNIDPVAMFDNMGPLFDAITERKGSWETTVEAWITDEYGPKVDVRQEFIANLGSRVTVVTDYTTPITVDSERSIVAIEVRNEQAVAAFIEKWKKAEGTTVRRQQLGDIVVWEQVPPEAQVDDLAAISPVFTRSTGATEKPKEDGQKDRVLPNSAVCVALGHLMMASDIEYLKEILAGFARRERLASSDDFEQVVETMNRVAPGQCSGWSFARMDEIWRPTFELVRQGKMPQSNSIFGKLLNNLLTTEVEREEGIRRKQRIDGSSLPNFEAVRRYFGPAGRALRSDQDGWILSGVILNKER